MRVASAVGPVSVPSEAATNGMTVGTLKRRLLLSAWTVTLVFPVLPSAAIAGMGESVARVAPAAAVTARRLNARGTHCRQNLSSGRVSRAFI